MSTTYTNERRVCVGCGSEYDFTPAEQQLFASRGWTPPLRCGFCRERRRRERLIEEEQQGASSVNAFSAFDARRRR